MNSIKSNFYSCFSLKNSEYNKNISTRSIFKSGDTLYHSITNSYAEKIVSFANAANDEKINYDYLLGWESAKVLLPKLCFDVKYKIRIMICFQSVMFVKGFYNYAKQQFPKFEFDRSFLVLDRQEEKQINGLFDNEKVDISFYKTYLDYENHSMSNKHIYDGIVSAEYRQIVSLHPKGFFLNIIPRNNPAVKIMFCSFIFRNVMLIDNPILSEVMTMNYYIHHVSRQTSRVLQMLPHEQSNYSPEVFEEIYKELELNTIMHALDDRQKQLNIFDYCSIWSSYNESFFKIKSTQPNIGDIIDFSLIKFPDNDNNNQNKESNP